MYLIQVYHDVVFWTSTAHNILQHQCEEQPSVPWHVQVVWIVLVPVLNRCHHLVIIGADYLQVLDTKTKSWGKSPIWNKTWWTITAHTLKTIGYRNNPICNPAPGLIWIEPTLGGFIWTGYQFVQYWVKVFVLSCWVEILRKNEWLALNTIRAQDPKLPV